MAIKTQFNDKVYKSRSDAYTEIMQELKKISPDNDEKGLISKGIFNKSTLDNAKLGVGKFWLPFTEKLYSEFGLEVNTIIDEKDKDSFSKNECKTLDHYVYALVNKHTKEIFYIGMGQGNRVFRHTNEKLKDIDDNEKIDKIDVVRRIGKENIEHYIIRYGLKKEEAQLVESVLIDIFQSPYFPSIMRLKNKNYGKDGYCIRSISEIKEEINDDKEV